MIINVTKTTHHSYPHYLLWVLLLTAIIISTRLLSMQVLPIYDDAFITLRYAQNLYLNHNFTYNLNEKILGTTSMGFGFLNTLFYMLHFPMPSFLVVFNIIVDILIFWLTAYLISAKKNLITISLFAIIFAVSPIVSRITVGGMEMNLFLLISLVSIYLYQQNHKYFSILFALGAYLLRPEAMLLIGVLITYEWFNGNKKNRSC